MLSENVGFGCQVSGRGGANYCRDIVVVVLVLDLIGNGLNIIYFSITRTRTRRRRTRNNLPALQAFATHVFALKLPRRGHFFRALARKKLRA